MKLHAAIRTLAACCIVALTAASTTSRAEDKPLQFQLDEGRIINAFYREGPTAAHLLLNSGTQPRVLVAFPAGNSGVGVWFEPSATPVQWHLEKLGDADTSDAQGLRPLHGIVAQTSVDGGALVIKDAALGSVRVLRDYQLKIAYPPETRANLKSTAQSLAWTRDRIDGKPGYAIRLDVENGSVNGGNGKPWTIAPAHAGAAMRIRITALTGEAPLTPLTAAHLFNAQAGTDERSRNALQFLSYQEKFLAGSWRFDTYFGRDTLLSLRMLMPALQPEAIEDGLSAVLSRLSAKGEVAHEEDIGEFAVLRHRKQADTGPADAPIYDYTMVDGDVLLAPVAAAYLLDDTEGQRRAAEFFARKTAAGEPVGAAFVRNFALVLRSAQPFAEQPMAQNLISFKAGKNVGQWRDSEDGNAGGRYAYDVNAVLMPAALAAIARFEQAGLLKPYLTADTARFGDGAKYAASWSARAPALFATNIAGATAREDIAAYAKQEGIDAKAALASLPRGDLAFHALALDAAGKPLPVLHSDESFALLFGKPAPAQLEAMVGGMLRPFPAGLLTDVGVVVANPTYADAAIQKLFGRTAYHGTVVWSWQQALLAAGLARQLQRTDIPASTRTALAAAQTKLWKVIDATQALRTSELWSWSYRDGNYKMEPFGQSSGDADESNAAQLWSTVYLAIPRPK